MAQRGLSELEMRYNFSRTALITKNVTKVLSTLIRVGCIGWCFIACLMQ